MDFFRTEQKLYERLKAGDKKALEKVYLENYRALSGLARKMRIDEDDAKDMIQDVILIFRDNVFNGKFRLGESKISTYIYGIAKNYLSGRFNSEAKRKNAIVNLVKDIFEDNSEDFEDEYQKMIEVSDRVLEDIGETCKKILKMRHAYKYSMEEIAIEMNLKNAKIARDRKYECEKKAKKIANDLLNRHGHERR